MIQKIYIENLKCGGCANTIKKGISSIEEVTNIEINVDESLVAFESPDSSLTKIKEKLSKLGYPEVGDKNTVLHKAKSFVSCATGKMSKE
ncbi:Copper chaperone CopZ [Tenacibaculum sp. MAR_2009_124]|uniref:heavy-metal-associated domain-containing protein n=1 Tax=Tenacibaculum sp. MAR_2009_124 TaxID=1250059 RepID=UPI00089433F6|nr:heavy-metal-associated domain-containing protein [Tenacibaculum sp. MAR_2009_124]SEB98571.1 Copper chaperone CopZ [Tenacibaculum sp. MAR_2009_124]